MLTYIKQQIWLHYHDFVLATLMPLLLLTATVCSASSDPTVPMSFESGAMESGYLGILQNGCKCKIGSSILNTSQRKLLTWNKLLPNANSTAAFRNAGKPMIPAYSLSKLWLFSSSSTYTNKHNTILVTTVSNHFQTRLVYLLGLVIKCCT